MKIKDLIRPEVLKLKPYVPATKVLDKVRLNANESPYSVTQSATMESLNFIQMQPDEIRNMVARYLDISSDNIVITRGSTEAIDVRSEHFAFQTRMEYWCSPTFEMYKFYAEVQGEMHSILLDQDNNYSLDLKALEAFDPSKNKLTFICSPSNPLGHKFSKGIHLSCMRIFFRFGLVVLDGAYVEFDSDKFIKRFCLNMTM